MIVGEALARWLGDRPARAAGRARIADFAARWAEETPLAALDRALAETEVATAGAVATLVRPLLADPAWAIDLIGRLIAEARRDPFFEPPIPPVTSGIQSGLQLYVGRYAAIAIGVGALDRLAAKKTGGARAGVIAFTGHLGLMRVIRPGGATLSLWEGGWRDGVILPACRAIGERRLAAGETLEIDGRTTSFLIDHARADMVLLHATILAEPAPTTCEYDARTLALAAIGAARDGASRTQMLASLLGAMARDDAGDGFEAASRAPEPFVRWHAMRAWLALDPNGATPRLHEMAGDDADAELRALARRTLALLAPCPA